MPVRVALLGCGPSLSRYPGTGYDLVIAVNRAATAHRCDWWSVGDAETYWRYQASVIGTPLLWTHYNTVDRIARHAGGPPIGKAYFRDERVRWSLWSATAGLWLASTIGDEVTCYGCDMAGELNWDGTAEPTADRTPARWERERSAWDGLASTLAIPVKHG